MDPFEILLVMVVANLVVGLACSIAVPRQWGLWLCVMLMIINVFPLFLAFAAIFGMITGRLDSMASLLVFPGMLIFLEELWFLHIFSRYRRRQHPPPQ